MTKSIRTEIIIQASKEKVWNILTDFSAYPAWNPFLIRIEGKLIAGGRLRNTMLNGSRQFVIMPVIQRVVPTEYFDWIGHIWVKGIFDGHHYFELEDLGSGQVKLTQGEHFSGLLSGYIFKKIAEDTRANFIKMNQAVKKLAQQV